MWILVHIPLILGIVSLLSFGRFMYVLIIPFFFLKTKESIFIVTRGQMSVRDRTG